MATDITKLFFSLIPSFSITQRSQSRVWTALEMAQDIVGHQPAFAAWMRRQGVAHLAIDLVYDEYRQRPLTVKAGPDWAGHTIRVQVFRESWVEASMSREHCRAWVFLVVNEALSAVTELHDLPVSVRVPLPAAVQFPFVRVEVQGAIAKPGKLMSQNGDLDAWLRAARLVCDALNDHLVTAGLVSTRRPELELVATRPSRARRESKAGPDSPSGGDLIGPEPGFATLQVEDRVTTVLAQVQNHMIEQSGCEASEVESVFTTVTRDLRQRSWAFVAVSAWTPSPGRRREAQWIYKVDALSEAVMRVDVRDEPKAPHTTSDWVPAGPTAMAVATIAPDALIWVSDDVVEFSRPHEMNLRLGPIVVEVDTPSTTH